MRTRGRRRRRREEEEEKEGTFGEEEGRREEGKQKGGTQRPGEKVGEKESELGGRENSRKTPGEHLSLCLWIFSRCGESPGTRLLCVRVGGTLDESESTMRSEPILFASSRGE